MHQQHHGPVDVERLDRIRGGDQEIAAVPWPALEHVQLAELQGDIGS